MLWNQIRTLPHDRFSLRLKWIENENLIPHNLHNAIERNDIVESLVPLARRIRSIIIGHRRRSRRPCGYRISAAALLRWSSKKSTRVRTTRFDRRSRSNWRWGVGEVIGGHENALRRPPLVPAGSLRHFTVRFGNGEEQRGGNRERNSESSPA
uniref:Uncharacterized protein n=1 Tax=Cucumis sativus TaxID=3659 RepID=A0A0A0LDR3_CUCSA